MPVITDCASCRPENGLCLTIGNFDGLHLGHQALISSARDLAKKSALDFAIMTFWPHPRTVLPARTGHMPLATRRDRLELLAASGACAVIELPFTPALAALSPAEFVESFLAPMNLRHLVVGHDFTLGKDRSGTIDVLRKLGQSHNFKVDQIDGIHFDGAAVSSSRLRQTLLKGDVESAAKLLGRFYRLEGKVAHGEGRGSSLGFPTANLAGIETLLPADGVYATFAWHNGHCWPAVTSIGSNPTFNGLHRTVETFIPGETINLYDSLLRLDFVARIRGMTRFPDVPSLVKQMAADTARAMDILNHVENGFA